MHKNITLAIETAVGNGSLSLFENSILMDQWSSETKISRSDQFLPALAAFLNKNNLDKTDLDVIAVSLGPGSFTGARVGLATALALKNGLNIKCVGISILQAIALTSFPDDRLGDSSIAAISSESGEVIYGIYEAIAKNDGNNEFSFECQNEKSFGKSKLQAFNAFVEELKTKKQSTDLFLEKSLYEKVIQKFNSEISNKSTETFVKIYDIGSNLSICIGKAIINGNGSDNDGMIYI